MYAELNPYIFISLAYAITILSLLGYATTQLLKAQKLKQLLMQESISPKLTYRTESEIIPS